MINWDNIAFFVPTMNEVKMIFNSSEIVQKDGLNGIVWNGQFVIICGCGKVNAAITLTRYLSHDKTDKTPLLIGIAGGYRRSGATVGDLCFVDREHFVDEAIYTEQNGNDSLIGTDKIGFPICPDNSISLMVPNLPILPIYSSNTVSILPGTDEMSEVFHEKTNAHIENMEGAAFALAGEQFNRKVMEIRAVSNYCGSRLNQEWNIKKAAKVLNDFVRQIKIS